jgi:hypothetical protein
MDAGLGIEIGRKPTCDYASTVAIAPLPACHAKQIFNFEPVMKITPLVTMTMYPTSRFSPTVQYMYSLTSVASFNVQVTVISPPD